MAFHIYQRPYVLSVICIAMIFAAGVVTCFESPLLSCQERCIDDPTCDFICHKKGFVKGGSCKPIILYFLCCCMK
ncbi:hypothetical protein JHK82_023486 [Glycine max]|uniref:Knottin scorpion toxin-like domain-containing protein n=2 Tax=Glycine subgen. Soja TaxID=1462606 RepID=I1KZD4_SOYBN|nr:hypothetical protein JHK87_023434 [Glycine soja]KAG5017957.1 hypothetical protein JHK85_024093 [Glycine max]KAG5027634.1 hypothetical protein JHK86_023548 [Glycine max]KAG5138755.1 hypothetical protein JHK82_023486 [Glycine max]KAH1054703.1 hypothetical protein GYH30_023465 [Glycine max]